MTRIANLQNGDFLARIFVIRVMTPSGRPNRLSMLRFRLIFLSLLLLLPRVAVADAKTDSIEFIFALYFSPEPKVDPIKRLNELLAGECHELTEVGSVLPQWQKTDDFPPPSASAFRYCSHGLEPGERDAIAASPRVLGLIFKASTKNLIPMNRLADDLVARLADDTWGYPWDDECRLLYSRDAWRTRRVDAWQGDIPDVRGEVNMHSYRNPELTRNITLGMRKFNLPDLVMSEVAADASNTAGNTINACAQRLLEGARVEGGRLQLDLSGIRHEGVRKNAQSNPRKGARGRITIAFRNATRDEGDPDNRLWNLDFPEMKAKTPTERQYLAFADLFGAEEEVLSAKKGDPEMQAARDKARKDFFAREQAFRKGLEPGEHLLVKKGYVFGSDTEYMWVEVLKWNEHSIDGVLANDSVREEKIRSGQRVTVDFDEIYDYLLYRADGTEVGNETGKVLERREGK